MLSVEHIDCFIIFDVHFHFFQSVPRTIYILLYFSHVQYLYLFRLLFPELPLSPEATEIFSRTKYTSSIGDDATPHERYDDDANITIIRSVWSSSSLRVRLRVMGTLVVYGI